MSEQKIEFEFGGLGVLILISIYMGIGILMGHYWWPI